LKVLKNIEPLLVDVSLGLGGINCDIGLTNLVPINVMGGGILKIFSIILAILDTENGIVLIDEIENGLYYSSQEILWNAVLEIARECNVQIFATTHSIENIKALSSSHSKIWQKQNVDNLRLYRIERKNGGFKVLTYNSKMLAESLDSKWEVR
jgi:AAA15 family ATPase/GTPase